MKTLLSTVSVLGVPYSIFAGTTLDFPVLKNSDGYCDTSIKEIIVSNMAEAREEPDSLVDLPKYQRKVIRHELIHAALFESGLSVNSEWASDEEAIDWIAIQFPKLLTLFNAAECLEDGD